MSMLMQATGVQLYQNPDLPVVASGSYRIGLLSSFSVSCSTDVGYNLRSKLIYSFSLILFK